MKTISAEEFLSRSEADDQIVRRHYGPRSKGPTIHRLFAAGLDRKEQVEALIRDIQAFDCQIHFEDNPSQRNYAPSIVVTGASANLLRALGAIVTTCHPDEVFVDPEADEFSAWWD